MRVKYPIDNLENRKKFMNHNIYRIQFNNLAELGYALKHGDFSQKKMKEIFEKYHEESIYFRPRDFCHYISSDVCEISNYGKYKDCILIALDFVLSYFPTGFINGIVFYDIEFFEGTEFWEGMVAIRNIVVNYIEENKEEFPEIYLELMLR